MRLRVVALLLIALWTTLRASAPETNALPVAASNSSSAAVQATSLRAEGLSSSGAGGGAVNTSTNTLNPTSLLPGIPPLPAVPSANNSRCFVCHANYEEEPLSVSHAKAGIGCIRCHGNSSPHSTDEDGLTAPDRMYPKAHVRLNCLSCHDWLKLVQSDKTKADRADLPEKPDHQAVLDGTRRDKRFCTDCHGEHRMYFRTKGWNKRSGALIFKDGIPLMLPNTPK